jgi:hypothetical protein
MIAVTKLQRMLTSFVAVIPAAFLVYLLVMAMLSYSENLSTMSYVVMAGTLLSALATVLIPVLIMMGGKTKPTPAKVVAKRDKHDSGEIVEAVDGSDAEVISGSSGSFDAHDVLEESSEIDIGNSDQDMLGGESEAEIETEPVEDLDDFDLEEMEDVEEEEEAPKSKKKKR